MIVYQIGCLPCMWSLCVQFIPPCVVPWDPPEVSPEPSLWPKNNKELSLNLFKKKKTKDLLIILYWGLTEVCFGTCKKRKELIEWWCSWFGLAVPSKYRSSPLTPIMLLLQCMCFKWNCKAKYWVLVQKVLPLLEKYGYFVIFSLNWSTDLLFGWIYRHGYI